MAGITDEIIEKQKKLEKRLAEAKQEVAKCEKEAVAAIKDTWSGPVEQALKAVMESSRLIDQGLKLMRESLRVVEKDILPMFDMLKRKAKDAEDSVKEMQETAAAAEKAAKADKTNKDAQKKAELAAKALEKAEKGRDNIKSDLKDVVDRCKRPLYLMDGFEGANWADAIKKLAKAVEDMKDASKDKGIYAVHQWW
ncbi:MAG TPA: hypothetical protein VFW33_08845 [Gemmataceae bacterium]|nr:hypothetical protein [Gemmataceae bacterium]